MKRTIAAAIALALAPQVTLAQQLQPQQQDPSAAVVDAEFQATVLQLQHFGAAVGELQRQLASTRVIVQSQADALAKAEAEKATLIEWLKAAQSGASQGPTSK